MAMIYIGEDATDPEAIALRERWYAILRRIGARDHGAFAKTCSENIEKAREVLVSIDKTAKLCAPLSRRFERDFSEIRRRRLSQLAISTVDYDRAITQLDRLRGCSGDL